MNVVVLFGTESGTAEMVAGDLADRICSDYSAKVSDLAEFPVVDLSAQDFYVIVCSTYGEGDPPYSAKPFVQGLDDLKPDLSEIRFAMFGLGDSGYPDTYNHGSELLAEKLEGLGARRVGEHQRHDASGRDNASDVALDWIDGVLEAALADRAAASALNKGIRRA